MSNWESDQNEIKWHSRNSDRQDSWFHKIPAQEPNHPLAVTLASLGTMSKDGTISRQLPHRSAFTTSDMTLYITVIRLALTFELFPEDISSFLQLASVRGAVDRGPHPRDSSFLARGLFVPRLVSDIFTSVSYFFIATATVSMGSLSRVRERVVADTWLLVSRVVASVSVACWFHDCKDRGTNSTIHCEGGY